MTTPPSTEKVLSQNVRWFTEDFPLPAHSPEEWGTKGKYEFKHNSMIGAALLEGLVEQLCYTRQDQSILLSMKLRGEDAQLCSVEGNDLSALSAFIISQILSRIDPDKLRSPLKPS